PWLKRLLLVLITLGILILSAVGVLEHLSKTVTIKHVSIPSCLNLETKYPEQTAKIREPGSHDTFLSVSKERRSGQKPTKDEYSKAEDETMIIASPQIMSSLNGI